MKISYHKKYSSSLGRDMEYKTYGEEGRPVLVFPSQDGRYFDFENFDMISGIANHIESGKIRLICVDGIDGETWSDKWGDQHKRIVRHEQWFRYVVDELIPDVRRTPTETFVATGCSMGGYHAANFFFRRPEFFDTLLALSGIYWAGFFFPNYTDPLVYDNSPYDYLSNMPADHKYWNEYRKRRIIMCVGQGAWEDDLLESTRKMDSLFHEHGVDAWVDYWGYDVSHDWLWWRRQLPYFMEKILG